MSQPVEHVREQIVGLLPRLRRFARSITHHVDDADDLVQIVIERALTRCEQWRPDTRLESWMFGIMRNAWIDELRARRRRDQIFAPEEAGENVGEATTDAQVHVWSVQEAMTRLPEEQKFAVSLVLIEGLSYKEAATVMEVPIGTLTSRLARGREALEAILSDAKATDIKGAQR
jgi:RNA polymerase sigma-70 factor (ECF subfamily)